MPKQSTGNLRRAAQRGGSDSLFPEKDVEFLPFSGELKSPCLMVTPTRRGMSDRLRMERLKRLYSERS